ncbi:hypothetical protein VAE308_1560001 [Vibrio aestuarianus]|uniref:Uncharacterized protein n=2 Tax=Vibrio aestuarianus TaxID=28171 RepID=A0ABM9FL83_9VIBR|nr:hypothetical protein VAE142_1080003 [Vibrio aestuarianus]CAH8207924.1 hypothetical protein VAE063_660004 [Vibrio aestuarianus]CAH8231446.1 hypothetical protein VAE308_1560001 [Vibrio aestuarianus]
MITSPDIAIRHEANRIKNYMASLNPFLHSNIQDLNVKMGAKSTHSKR